MCRGLARLAYGTLTAAPHALAATVISLKHRGDFRNRVHPALARLLYHGEIAAEAIDEWMRRHDPDAIPMPATKGYQRKSVFLADGTLLRTVFGGKNYQCLVVDDGISYNGQAVSPSAFVNVVGGIRRNTWRCTWILFPQASQWQLADTLRTRAWARPLPWTRSAVEPGLLQRVERVKRNKRFTAL